MKLDRFAFEQAPDPIFLVTAHGRIRDANEAACRWLGYAQAELLSCSVWTINPSWPEDRWAGIWTTLTEEWEKLVVASLVHRDGRLLAVDLRVRLYVGAEGVEVLLYAHERLPAQDALHELQRLRDQLKVSESIAQLGHWRLALASGRPEWSEQVFALFARDPALGEPSFEEHARYVDETDWPRLREAVDRCAKQAIPYALTLNIRRDDGTTGAVRVFGSALAGEGSSATELVGFVLDVSEQQALEQRLLSNQRRLDIALDVSGIGVYSVDLTTNEAIADGRYLAMLGYAPDEVNMSVDWWHAQLHPADVVAMDEAIGLALSGAQDQFHGEYRMRHREGHWVWIDDYGRTCERDADGQPRLIVGVHSDISERKRAERRLAFRASHDLLTRLPNRHSFWGTLKRVHASALRSNRAYCIAMLDLDLFKAVNDEYGHRAGDQVLHGFAALLRQVIREADWTARWGGEEFIVLMPDTTLAQARQSMERLRGVLAASALPAGEQLIHITLSIGIAEYRLEDKRPDSVITRADSGLYQAKRLGRNRVYCLEPGVN